MPVAFANINVQYDPIAHQRPTGFGVCVNECGLPTSDTPFYHGIHGEIQRQRARFTGFEANHSTEILRLPILHQLLRWL